MVVAVLCVIRKFSVMCYGYFTFTFYVYIYMCSMLGLHLHYVGVYFLEHFYVSFPLHVVDVFYILF